MQETKQKTFKRYSKHFSACCCTKFQHLIPGLYSANLTPKCSESLSKRRTKHNTTLAKSRPAVARGRDLASAFRQPGPARSAKGRFSCSAESEVCCVLFTHPRAARRTNPPLSLNQGAFLTAKHTEAGRGWQDRTFERYHLEGDLLRRACGIHCPDKGMSL